MASAIVKLPSTIIAAAKPRFNIFMRYAKVEMAPPTPGDIPAIREGIGKLINSAQTGKWKQFTVKDAWINTLIGAEVVFWFFIGETIGKRNIVGYRV